ncbi:MAG: cation diffusion facilitator family transporter [Chloroflexota bacterium]|nr:cation diffusion facilitator family transporter [Chloroflexota bacterium]
MHGEHTHTTSDHDTPHAAHAPHGTEHEHDHHDHEHGDGHPHAHDEHHEHDRKEGPLAFLLDLLPFGHGHSHAEANVDAAMETSVRGIWALKVSLLGLGATALFQVFVVIISGSIALLADTIHNASDALTAVPLWIAFSLGRRPANERYTYGYGRAEDLAGVVVVLMIALSAVVAAYESVQKLMNPSAPSNLIWVAVASIVGFVGNEAVAAFRIRVGNEIGSAALVADGQHARVDGLTSLAVMLGVIGVWLGFPIADPIVGLLITVAILFILKDTAVTMWHRMMDAVDPQLVRSIRETAQVVPGVVEDSVHEVRVRWLGHKLYADLHISVDEDLPTRESHRIGEEVRHALLHAQPKLSVVTVHIDPCEHGGSEAHDLVGHHFKAATKNGPAR